MTKKLACLIANYFASKGQYPKDKINVYIYGFELLISTVFNAIGILIISIIMGIVMEAILFSLALVLLRATAGGYHAKHHWSCFLTTNIVFILFAVILNFLAESFVLSYTVFTTLLVAILIWSFSPFRAVNNPLNKAQKDIFRKRSIIIVTINMALTFVFAFVPRLPIIYLAYYQSGALAASISLAVAVLGFKYKYLTKDRLVLKRQKAN